MKHKTAAVIAVFCAPLLSALVGVAVGYAYDYYNGVRFGKAFKAIARFPQSSAAELTFRFGKAEQARTLLSAVPIPECDDETRWGALQLRDIRTAVICKELNDTWCEAANRASAAKAWHRRGKTFPTPEVMSKALDVTAKHRTP